MKKRKILTIGTTIVVATYLASYSFLRVNETYITYHSIAGGVITKYVAFNWRQSPKWDSKKEYLENIDDPITRSKAENDGGIYYYTPLVFLEEKVRGIGRDQIIEEWL